MWCPIWQYPIIKKEKEYYKHDPKRTKPSVHVARSSDQSTPVKVTQKQKHPHARYDLSSRRSPPRAHPVGRRPPPPVGASPAPHGTRPSAAPRDKRAGTSARPCLFGGGARLMRRAQRVWRPATPARLGISLPFSSEKSCRSFCQRPLAAMLLVVRVGTR
uniref:Uncharacterized protein n=1 Tax=Setaria viridis TaxID=4556 RepID=A0A4V6D629_SETVI|nr:hypothetical protein SEVIR_5G056700v2 [Setaria viridis]